MRGTSMCGHEYALLPSGLEHSSEGLPQRQTLARCVDGTALDRGCESSFRCCVLPSLHIEATAILNGQGQGFHNVLLD
jgi:hypothetical protein